VSIPGSQFLVMELVEGETLAESQPGIVRPVNLAHPARAEQPQDLESV
jgi:hypothetical protein